MFIEKRGLVAQTVGRPRPTKLVGMGGPSRARNASEKISRDRTILRRSSRSRNCQPAFQHAICWSSGLISWGVKADGGKLQPMPQLSCSINRQNTTGLTMWPCY